MNAKPTAWMEVAADALREGRVDAALDIINQNKTEWRPDIGDAIMYFDYHDKKWTVGWVYSYEAKNRVAIDFKNGSRGRFDLKELSPI